MTAHTSTQASPARGPRGWLLTWTILGSAVAFAALSAGCGLSGTRGEGPVETETRSEAGFSRIDASAGIAISVQTGPAATLQVRAQENILPLIATEVVNGTLRIDSTRSYTTSEKVEVVITTPSLTGVVLSGGSVARIEGLLETALDIDLSGGSRLTATGEAADLALEVSGGSVATLDGLEAQTIEVNGSGGSRATVRASQRVRGSASGGSSIVVIGDAELSVDVTGASNVSRG